MRSTVLFVCLSMSCFGCLADSNAPSDPESKGGGSPQSGGSLAGGSTDPTTAGVAAPAAGLPSNGGTGGSVPTDNPSAGGSNTPGGSASKGGTTGNDSVNPGGTAASGGSTQSGGMASAGGSGAAGGMASAGGSGAAGGMAGGAQPGGIPAGGGSMVVVGGRVMAGGVPEAAGAVPVPGGMNQVGGMPGGGLAIAPGGVPAPENVCDNVNCSDRGECVLGDQAQPTCACDLGYIASGLACEADPVDIELKFIDPMTGDPIELDQLQARRMYVVKVTSIPAGRENELDLSDDSIQFSSPFGVVSIADIDGGDDPIDGEISVTLLSPGRVDLSVSAVWRPDGRQLTARTRTYTGLIEFTPGEEIIERDGYSLSDQDAMRLDEAEIPNQHNIEYIPVRFRRAGPVGLAVTPVYNSIIRRHFNPVAQRIWRSSRLSLHDSAGRQLAASRSDLASSYLTAQVEANSIYYLGVSYFAVCARGVYNVDRAFGLNVPNCGRFGGGYLERNEVSFDYELSMGTVRAYDLGETIIDSLSDTDIPVPQSENNYFDFYSLNLEQGQAYEWRYRPTRVGDDVAPLLQLLSNQPGSHGHGLFAPRENDPINPVPMLAGVFHAQANGEHNLAVLNNRRIENPGLGVAYGFSIKPVDANRTLELGRQLQFELEDISSPAGYVLNDLTDQRPLELLALPSDLDGRYRIRISAAFRVLVALVGNRVERNLPGKRIVPLRTLETDPNEAVTEIAVNIQRAQSTGLALTLPRDANGGIVIVKIDPCGPDGCDACENTRCDEAIVDGQLVRDIGGACEVGLNGRAQCRCPEGFVQAANNPRQCAQPCDGQACGGHGTCLPFSSGRICACDPGYSQDQGTRLECVDAARRSCSEFYQCYNACLRANNNESENCAGCYYSLTDDALEKLTAYRRCEVDSECVRLNGVPYQQCIDQNCRQENDICFDIVRRTPVRSDLAGDPLGGEPNQDLCGNGQVLIGLRGSIGDGATYLTQLQGVCGQPRLGLNGAISIDFAGLTPRRGNRPGTSSSANCPPNEVVVAASGRQGLLIDRIDLKCAPLIIDNGVLRPDQAVYRSSIGGNGGQPFAEISCPNGEIGIGLFTRSGAEIDAFALVCDEYNVP